MSVKIITGYTGQRHITPYMDAAVNRSIFGEGDCILSTGSQLSASMPTINSFVIADGAFSIQGHIGVSNGEMLAVDTCQNGYNRIDLVVARFTHSAETLIDNMEIVLVKGDETTSQYPTTPTVNSGSIADGASVVDMVLYKITLSGSNVGFQLVPLVRSWLTDYETDVLTKKSSTSSTEGNVGFEAYREDTDVGVALMVGASGTNHGVWSPKKNKWLVNYDANGLAKLDGKVIAQNSVLWTGGYYMSGSHTANLSQKVSDQANGIVLCWSAYVNGAAQNYDWAYQFIPRWHATAHQGNGVCTHMSTNEFQRIGSKYVYVYDTRIVGNDSNTKSGTANGITYNNAYWVLRAVIGV